MTTATFEQFLIDLRDLTEKYLGDGETKAIATAPPTRTKAKPAKAVEKDEPEDDDPQAERRKELAAQTEAALKRLAGRMGYEKADIEEATKEDIIATILADEAEALAEAEAEEEEEVEEEEEDEPSGAYERDDLIGQTLPQLKKIAKDEFGETTDSLKGLDKESVIAIILGETEEDEEAEEEEEEPEEAEEEAEDDDEEDDEEEAEEEVTEDSLMALSDAQLKAKARAWGYTVKPRMKREQIIDLFFAE